MLKISMSARTKTNVEFIENQPKTRTITLKKTHTEEVQRKMDNTMRMSCDKYVRLEGCATPILFFYLFMSCLLVIISLSCMYTIPVEKQCIES